MNELTYEQQVDAVVLNQYNRYESARVCDTPSLLVQLGFDPLPMFYPQRHLRDAIRPFIPNYSRHLHSLQVSQIKRLPELIADPVMIFKSPSHTGSYILVTDELDRKGRPIIVSIFPNGTSDYNGREWQGNVITSVYGRNNFRSFLRRAIDQNCMIYCNNEKSRRLFSLLAVTMPKGLNNTICFDSIIQQPKPKVNKGEIKMFDYHRNYLNATPFPNTIGFRGVQDYRIAAQLNGVVFGVSDKGNCAVWTGGYHANGELREVSGGHYFTGSAPEEQYNAALTQFTKMASTGVYEHKQYDLIMSDGYSIQKLGTFATAEDAQKAMESDYADKNRNTEGYEKYADCSDIYDGAAILYDRGSEVYTYNVFESTYEITKGELQELMREEQEQKDLANDYSEVIDAVEQRYGLMVAKRLLTEETAKAIVEDYQMKKANNDTARYLLSDAIDEHITAEQVESARHNKQIFFDTETTGLNRDGTDEILSISIINENEEILLHTYVKPEHHTSWEEAQEINKISPDMVKDSPTLTQLKPLLKEIFTSADEIIAYNIAYDRQFIEPALDIHFGDKARCAMLEFADYYKEPNLKTGYGYRWKSLSVAMENLGQTWRGQAHGSLADTYAAKDVWTALKNPSIEKKNTYEQSMKV